MASSGLQFFRVPPVDFRFEARRYVHYRPVYQGIEPITFHVPPTDDYMDIKEAKLLIKVRLKTSGSSHTGIKVPASRAISDATVTNNCTIVNNFAHTLIKQFNVKFNGILLTEQTNLYHYLAYLGTLLNYSPQEGETLLAPQGWVNGALNADAEITVAAANSDKIVDSDVTASYKKLEELTKKVASKQWFTFVMKPFIPVMQVGGFLIPGTSLEMELYLNPNTIYLYGAPNKGTLDSKVFPTITQEDIEMTLVIPKMTLNASVFNQLQSERQMADKAVTYPVVRTAIRTFSIPQGYTSWEQDDVFLNKMPDRVILAMVHTEAFNGKIERYPYAFERFGATSVRQTVNGEEYPYKTLELSNESNNKDATDYLGYERFLQASGAMRERKIPMVQPSDWGEGKTTTLFMFNNVPSGYADDPGHRNPQQSGNVRYKINFASATTHNITVLLWSEYETLLEINREGALRYNV